MMKQRVIYVFTHDSIGLGEDGPTHQPIEHLVSLRTIPNLNVFRPCDQIETFEAWEIALNTKSTPSVLALSRQNLPLVRKDFRENKSIKGAYLVNKSANAKISLIASGSEVETALSVKSMLLKRNIVANVVSIPCSRLFDLQTENYKNNILGDKPKVIIEAGSTLGWYKYIQKNDMIFGVDSFGESGKGKELFNFFGIEAKNIFDKINKKYFK